MENNQVPYISVIITAYNRKEFLLNSIKSVLNQTIDKKSYEIIVIKNFTDETIDDFINKNNIKRILMNGTVGEFLDKGILAANGEIISFLDDDDLFFSNKLGIVYNEFKKDNTIVYYHNLSVPINENGETININGMNASLDFNMSSISIKKSIVKIYNADKINTSQDTLMYLYALESGKNIIKGKEKLTYYMFHNSISNILSTNFEEYKKFIITKSDLNLNKYILFRNIFQSRKAIYYINSRTTDAQIYKYMFGSNKFPSKLINYIINSPGSLKFKIKLFISCILIKVYPRSRKYISTKMWNTHNQRSNEMI